MKHFLENELYNTLYQTITLASSIFILSCLIYMALIYGLKVSTSRQKLKTRITYLSGCAFIIFCAKIWVQGFTSIFYGISLVSAGLVVSNKESIMNLVGWGIISWRGLFSEGDFVEILGHNGIVVDIGILYIKLLEASPLTANRATGKTIKIPNGLVINNSIKRYNIDNFITEHHVQFLIPLTIDIETIEAKINTIIDNITVKYYQTQPKLKGNKNDLKLIQNYIYQKPLLSISSYLEKPDYYKITISYHAKACDKYVIEQEIIKNILKGAKDISHHPSELNKPKPTQTSKEEVMSI